MVRNLFLNKRAEAVGANNASGAAFLVLVITLLIVFYILFLPPADRANILNDDIIPGNPPSPSSGYSYLLGSTPLNQLVGHVDYVSQADIEHDLASFRIYTSTDAHVIATESSLYIKRSAFETKSKQVDFSIDQSASANLLLSFNVFRPEGLLAIHLNGIQIFEGVLDEGSPLPVELPQHLLKNNNILYFTVSSPGFAFWRVNQYELHNLQITGDITDSQNSFHMQKFYMADSEYEHMAEAEFSFFPDCTYGEVGNVIMTLNGNRIYYGTPDCGITNHIMLGKSAMKQGENQIEFTSERGSYIIDMPSIEVSLDDPEYPIYYFNLHEDLFTNANENDVFCGKVDGICPSNCNAYDDKDCCFEESNQNYWCDVDTINPHDRCVNTVLASYVGNCASGYEDNSGNPHPDIAGLCGDDTDGFCPSGCNSDYDKDCCYDSVPGAFWCSDIPFTGMNSVCTPVVTPAECDACPEQYLDENNQEPNCPTTPSSANTYATPDLKAGINILLEAYFATSDYKKVDFVINGNTVPIDTYALQMSRNINPYIHEGMNSIEVQPRRDIDISQLRVLVQ